MAALAAVHLALLAARVGSILLQPGKYILAPVGDGPKGYYALLWYLRHDSGTHYTGMNYPFGDYYGYTDGLPLLAWILRSWKGVFGLADSTAFAVLNLFILLASVPATLLLYAILRRCHVGQVWSAAAALLISFLAPQFLRFWGHLSLALTLAVPLLWWLQIQIQDAVGRGRRWRRVGAYVVALLLLGQCHPYYLIHGLLLTGSTAALTVVLAGRRWRTVLPVAAALLVAAVAPTLLTQLALGLVSSVTDRPREPYGFFVYHASPGTVFAPPFEPYASVWRAVFHHRPGNGEGLAYIGLITNLIGSLFLVRLAVRWWRNRGRRWRPVLPAPLLAPVWAAGPILLFAMCWPFANNPAAWSGLPLLIKQFRGLGRFAWLFYYISTVLAAVSLWQLYRLLRLRRLAGLGSTLLVLAALLWGLESKVHVETALRELPKFDFAHKLLTGDHYTQALARAGRAPATYQAILPLPYYHQGTDKIGREPIDSTAPASFRAALQTGLPLASTMMARISISQMAQSVGLFASDLLPKPILTQFPSRKPLLVLVAAPAHLTPPERALLRRARHLAVVGTTELYELSLDSLETRRPAAEARWFAQNRAALLTAPTAGGTVWRRTPGAGIVWNTFADTTAEVSFTRPGAFTRLRGDALLYNSTLPDPLPTDTATYELSYWQWLGAPGGLPWVEVSQHSPTGERLEMVSADFREAVEISGQWIRMNVVFRLTRPNNRVRVLIHADTRYVIDDLLIRPRTTPVWWLAADGRTVVYNGYPLSQ